MHNRYVCNVIEEFRDYLAAHSDKYSVLKKDTGHMLCLLEEMQTYVNRMEAHIADKADIRQTQRRLTRMQRELDKKEDE